jgi:uncharacterized protein
MPQRADILDLDSLHLPPGGGTRVAAEVPVAPVRLGGQQYGVVGGAVDARIDVSRTMDGFAFRLRFDASLTGPCMRCLTDASPTFHVDSREIEQPGTDDELHTPYLDGAELEVAGWVRDALLLALPPRLICRDECRGLCAVCGANLNEEDPARHRHERGGDPRWAKLAEIEFE